MTDERSFAGQQDGEEIRLFLRSHPLALAWAFRWVGLGMLVIVGGLAAFGEALGALGGLAPAITVAAGIALGLAALWVYTVWYYDVYIVTDQRLLDFARKPLIYERRDEAQLSKIQDIRADYPNPLALVLDFGNVTVHTAGSKGAITCSLVPRPRQVQTRILSLTAAAQQRTRAAGTAAAAEAGEMRQYLGLPGAPQDDAATQLPYAPPPPASMRAYLRGVMRPNLVLRPGDLVWRKHWWALLGATAVSGALVTAGLATGAIMLWKLGPGLWLAVPLAMLIVGGVWNLWNLVDWQNDLYILTEDRIIDIEKIPLISEDRREARLHQIQDVHYVMSGFINRFLDFGNVEVETAAHGGGFTFVNVPHPRKVQMEIFRRAERARKAAAETDHERREDDALALLYRYHQAGQPGGD